MVTINYLNGLEDMNIPTLKTYIYVTLMNLIHNNMRNAMKTVFKFPEKNTYGKSKKMKMK